MWQLSTWLASIVASATTNNAATIMMMNNDVNNNNSSLMDDWLRSETESQEETVHTLTQVTCGLSIVGSCAIILSFLCWPESQSKLLRRPIVVLSVCDLITGIAYLLPNESDSMCIAQALLGMLFPIASFLATDLIGLVLFLTVAMVNLKQSDMMRIIDLSLVGVIVIPIILVGIIAIADVEGRSPGFGSGVCWIREGHEWWRLAGGKIVEWFSFLFLLIVYLATLYQVKKIGHLMTAGQRNRASSLRLIFIPMAFIILRIPSAIRTIHDLASGEESIYWLSIMQALGDPGQGIVNGLCFALCKNQVRERYTRCACIRDATGCGMCCGHMDEDGSAQPSSELPNPSAEATTDHLRSGDARYGAVHRTPLLGEAV